MYILGINAYHGGASACLLKDHQLIAAIEEERINRIKYWAGFPAESIRYCLAEAGITAYDLDHIGISRNPNANLYKKVAYTLAKRPSFGFLRDRLANAIKVKDPKKALVDALQLNAASVKAQFHNIEHHRAHIASAFFVSPFEDAALISIDGMGDFVSTMWGAGDANSIEIKGRVNYPHSLGNFYTAVTQWLGFTKYGDEGKVMGLAPYGKPVYLDEMRRIVRLQRDGTFELNLDYFGYDTVGATMTWDGMTPVLAPLYSQKFVDLFGPSREPGSEVTEHHLNVAASLQSTLEEAEFNLVNMVQRATGKKALVMAGGVALNSSFNGKILPHTGFRDIYIQPAAGDAGTALGAAYYIYHQVLGHPRRYVMDRAYTGPRYDNDSIARALDHYSLSYDEFAEEELCRQTARLIDDGQVVGWFQGSMEWGPRALGNRSILADPRRADMKDILNARIKHREKFRPFAPSILLEATGDYFDQSYPDPFMTKVYNVRPEKQAVIPAVTHVDGTGRLQTVDRATTPLYWQVIKEFEHLSGVPVVLNTSFNDNEPIVCKQEEAIECFLRTRMDALAIGNYLVRKEK